MSEGAVGAFDEVWDSLDTGGFPKTVALLKTTCNCFSKIFNLNLKKQCLNCEQFRSFSRLSPAWLLLIETIFLRSLSVYQT